MESSILVTINAQLVVSGVLMSACASAQMTQSSGYLLDLQSGNVLNKDEQNLTRNSTHGKGVASTGGKGEQGLQIRVGKVARSLCYRRSAYSALVKRDIDIVVHFATVTARECVTDAFSFLTRDLSRGPTR